MGCLTPSSAAPGCVVNATEAMASELITIPRPMKVKSRLASNAFPPEFLLRHLRQQRAERPHHEEARDAQQEEQRADALVVPDEAHPFLQISEGILAWSGLRASGTRSGISASVP